MPSHMRLLSYVFLIVALAGSPGFATTGDSANWATEAIFYQIFPERFANGDRTNDPTRESLEIPINPGPSWHPSTWTEDWYSREDWEREMGLDFYKDGVFDRRYGGDLKGVIDKLDYLT